MAPGERTATTDEATAQILAARRIEQLEAGRRGRMLQGVSRLSQNVKAQITESLQHALTALGDRDLTTAVSALQSTLTTLAASSAPQPVKDAVSALLDCLITQLSA